MIGMQRYLGRNQLEGYRYVCSEDVPKTIQENLRFCRGNVAEHNESASVYVDYLSLITEWTAGNEDHVMDIIRRNYKLLVCLDSKDCLSVCSGRRTIISVYWGDGWWAMPFLSSVSLNGK